MKCLSIKQPWTWFIINGLKPVENRDWPSNYRGPLLIHASKKFDNDGWMYLCSTPAFRDDVDRYMKETHSFGSIIGKVDMVDCVTEHPSKWFFGHFGHVYANPVKFPDPIPYKGKLGIFDVPDDILKQVI